MSKDYTNEIGYESLQSDFKRYQKQTPRGVGMTKKGQNIYLQFKTPNSARKPYACNCTFTLDGMVDALRKSKLVKEKLEAMASEVEFWAWYDKEIKNESQLIDDRLTFGEAIKKVEDDFWSRPDRRKRERSKTNPSDRKTWHRKYGYFFQQLPTDNLFNLDDVMSVINRQEIGSSNYGEVVGTMKKLAKMNRRRDVYNALTELDTTQTKFMKLQSLNMDEFLRWRDETLGITKSLRKNARIDVRKAWLWVFSTQIVYGLRISEVIAIQNLTEAYVAEDGTLIAALNDPDNIENVIVIGEYTAMGTTTKTGFRLARPNIPPKYPNLIETLEIKAPLMPTNKPRSKNPITIVDFWVKTARDKLTAWNAPFTQTHADRHLGNINGMQAGIPLEVRAMSLGHTAAMNDNGYKKRIGAKTKIDLLLNSNQNAIDFVTALGEAKKLIQKGEVDSESVAKLLSIIYQKDKKQIDELL